MKKLTRALIPALLAGSLFLIPASGSGTYKIKQAPATAPAPKAAPTKHPAAAAPSAQDIADAKAKGMVWVNTGTHVYHKDGSLYGTTKRGKFMTEDDAKKAGYRAASQRASAKKASAPSTATK